MTDLKEGGDILHTPLCRLKVLVSGSRSHVPGSVQEAGDVLGGVLLLHLRLLLVLFGALPCLYLFLSIVCGWSGQRDLRLQHWGGGGGAARLQVANTALKR